MVAAPAAAIKYFASKSAPRARRRRGRAVAQRLPAGGGAAAAVRAARARRQAAARRQEPQLPQARRAPHAARGSACAPHTQLRPACGRRPCVAWRGGGRLARAAHRVREAAARASRRAPDMRCLCLRQMSRLALLPHLTGGDRSVAVCCRPRLALPGAPAPQLQPRRGMAAGCVRLLCHPCRDCCGDAVLAQGLARTAMAAAAARLSYGQARTTQPRHACPRTSSSPAPAGCSESPEVRRGPCRPYHQRQCGLRTPLAATPPLNTGALAIRRYAALNVVERGAELRRAAWGAPALADPWPTLVEAAAMRARPAA